METISNFFSNIWDYIQANPLLSISSIPGIVVLIILIYLYFRLRRKSASPTKTKKGVESIDISDNEDASVSPYTPMDIRGALARGMSQDDISDILKGVRVRWLGGLLHARPEGEDMVKVTIEFEDVGMYPVVFCTVPLSRYPELKELYQGTRVTVQGTISSISDMHISLDNAVLSLGI